MIIRVSVVLRRTVIRAYVWRRYFCRRLARDLKVLKILFCTRLYGFVPSSISSGSVRCYNRSQLKSVRKQVTIYIIRYWNGKQFSTYNLFSINPWNPTSATEQRNVSVKEVKLVLLNSCHLMSHDLIFPASLSRGDNWQYGNFRTLFAWNANQTVCDDIDWHLDNLSRSHYQSQVNCELSVDVLSL